MFDRFPLPPRAELEAMISRAEAACAQYRRDAAEPGLSPVVARKRRDKSKMMEQTVARLREQQAPAANPKISKQLY